MSEDFKLPHGMTAICQHVFADERPVLLVSNMGDHWQMLCGGIHEDGPRVVGMSHLLARDATLLEILDLPEGWDAERAVVGGVWVRVMTED